MGHNNTNQRRRGNWPTDTKAGGRPRERVDQMKVMDYPLLVKEYSDEVGKTTKETVFVIIRYVLDNAGSYFNLDKEKIDETVRIVELDFAEMINRLMPQDKRNIGEYPL